MRAHTSVSAVDAMRRIAAGPSPIPGISLSMEAAFSERGGIRPLRDRLTICRPRACLTRALGRLLRSAWRLVGRRGPSSGSTGHLHPILLRDTRCRSGRPHSDTARGAFVTAHGDLMPDALLWPPHIRLTRQPPFPSIRTDTDAAVPESRGSRCAMNRSSMPIDWRATFPNRRPRAR